MTRVTRDVGCRPLAERRLRGVCDAGRCLAAGARGPRLLVSALCPPSRRPRRAPSSRGARGGGPGGGPGRTVEEAFVSHEADVKFQCLDLRCGTARPSRSFLEEVCRPLPCTPEVCFPDFGRRLGCLVVFRGSTELSCVGGSRGLAWPSQRDC